MALVPKADPATRSPSGVDDAFDDAALERVMREVRAVRSPSRD